ncbi:diguanylate cyclase [Metabacillus sp. GX 13764]|uniref:sensor domain-containing diguanylate cyclase n=1 Tax=Metabacillus kandeliae TaxID=2900151 RepID=UPI001E45664D|nr:diguanylate cyclase [Metabacillus kandeliae]MCD7032746.1 diguanylate cyclase [Metabacillus kandeliae]
MAETNSQLLRINQVLFDYITRENEGLFSKAAAFLLEVLKNECALTDAELYLRKTERAFLPLSAAASSYNYPLHLSENDWLSLQSDGVLVSDGVVTMSFADASSIIFQAKGSVERSFLTELSFLCNRFLHYVKKAENLALNERKYEQLYRLTEKFHSTMNKDEVLGELLVTLQGMYQNYLFYLFLSHDSEIGELPVKDLYFEENGSNDTAMEAYLTGMVKSEKNEAFERTVYYIPLKGQQGIYGVLEVIVDMAEDLEQRELKFLVMVANAAGNAMENAQLYEQSNKLIADLQLINETSHKLNTNLRLNDTMEFMSKQIIQSFGAEEIGFFYSDQDTMTQPLPGCTEFFKTDAAGRYRDFVTERLASEKDGVFIGSLGSYLDSAEYQCLMGVPMIENNGMKGYAVILHQTPYAFTFDMFKLLQSLIHHSSLALANSLLREELEQLVKTDHMTKLYSRKYLSECIQRSMQRDREGAFILVDIDNFKRINDTYGHQVGDEVIIQVAALLKLNIREQDTGSRWGGEELAIYLPSVSMAAGIAIAERLVGIVAESTMPAITISCGVAHWEAGSDDSEKKLFIRADKALYKAKSSGKNRVVSETCIWQ